jgi:hypothetical protein
MVVSAPAGVSRPGIRSAATPGGDRQAGQDPALRNYDYGAAAAAATTTIAERGDTDPTIGAEAAGARQAAGAQEQHPSPVAAAAGVA